MNLALSKCKIGSFQPQLIFIKKVVNSCKGFDYGRTNKTTG